MLGSTSTQASGSVMSGVAMLLKAGPPMAGIPASASSSMMPSSPITKAVFLKPVCLK
eukprot:SAG22_NODE_2156_length_2919_cov_1.605674_2_plen_57_part_00